MCRWNENAIIWCGGWLNQNLGMKNAFEFLVTCALVILIFSGALNGVNWIWNNILLQNSYGAPKTPQYANANVSIDPQTFLSPSSLNSSSLVEKQNLKGSIPTFPTIIQAFKSQLNYTLADAATVALNAVGQDSLAVSSALQSEAGFLVYNIILIGADNQIHIVVIDAGNGNLLADTVVSPEQLSTSRPTPGSPPVMASPLAPPPPPHGGGFVLPVPPSAP